MVVNANCFCNWLVTRKQSRARTFLMKPFFYVDAADKSCKCDYETAAKKSRASQLQFLQFSAPSCNNRECCCFPPPPRAGSECLYVARTRAQLQKHEKRQQRASIKVADKRRAAAVTTAAFDLRSCWRWLAIVVRVRVFLINIRRRRRRQRTARSKRCDAHAKRRL